MRTSMKALTATLTVGMTALSISSCSEDHPTGPGGTSLHDGARPDVVLLAAPANDDFDNPVVVDALPFTDTLPTAEATTAGDDPIPTCAAGGTGPTVWYAFTANRRMRIEANTFGSDYDTDLVVFTGTRGNLSEVACNDDSESLQSSVTIELVRGQTYYIMVGAFASGPGGTLVFNLDVGRKEPAPQVRFRGKGADAFFLSESDCVVTTVQITASLRSFKDGANAPSRAPFAAVFIDRYDTCAEAFLSSIAASTTAGVALQVDNRLTQASLQVTMSGFDFVNETEVTIAADLDWTGSGTLVTTSGKTREVFPGGHLITQFRGTRRGATASGTVSVDGVSLTPEATGNASIFNAKERLLVIDHSAS